ncbi:hypothetical protein BS47DRAFT_1367111 [Hydnum rufescens UP504]|uniref:Uncharacterized protein n=1 Tax=Hydnum rufescens UP504 TaxID=1448309 RepID=A0A9P6AJ40_9AGAM|nr:hypothetical protein BS47DRAFT_1367111 [Hydnum rufescens UP504]
MAITCGFNSRIEAWSKAWRKTRKSDEGPNDNVPNGNMPDDVTHGNAPNDATYGNVPNEDTTYGHMPNENAMYGNVPNEGPMNHTPTMAGVWSYIRLRPCPTMSPNSNAMHGNAIWQCNTATRHGNATYTNATHANTPHQRAKPQCANNATYGTVPNEGATRSNNTPGITHPQQQVSTPLTNEY